MAKTKQERALEKLEDVCNNYNGPVLFMFKDGSQRTGYLEHVDKYLRDNVRLYYSSNPGFRSSVIYEGSKVDPLDYLPSISAYDLGFIVLQETGRKVSLMPFQKPVVKLDNEIEAWPAGLWERFGL